VWFDKQVVATVRLGVAIVRNAMNVMWRNESEDGLWVGVVIPGMIENETMSIGTAMNVLKPAAAVAVLVDSGTEVLEWRAYTMTKEPDTVIDSVAWVVVEETKIVGTEEEMETNKTMTRTMIGEIMIVVVATTELQIGKVVVVGMIEEIRSMAIDAIAVGPRGVVDNIRETTGTTKGNRPLLIAEVVCRNDPGPIAL
jgi:hypothetical protein